MLAGLVQSPTTYEPDQRPARPHWTRRNTVLQRMSDLGDITPAQLATAKKAPLGPR